MKRLIIGVAAAALIALSGCSTGTLSDDYTNPANDPQYQQAEQYEIEQDRQADEYAANDDADRDGEPDWKEGARALDEELNERNRLRGEAQGKGWGGESRLRSDGEFEERCEYAPTMNYDWHDDYVCDGQRLYLLPNDEFVTEQELEQAAREYVR